MFLSILEIVILPVALGLMLKTFLSKVGETVASYTPGVSSLTICLILAGVIGASHDAILNHFGMIMLVVVLFNLFGYLLGFAAAKLNGLSWKKSVTLAIEVGVQNSGLATGLSKVHFASLPAAVIPAAVIPGALFSAWFTISGAVLAWVCTTYLNPYFDKENNDDTSKNENVAVSA